MDTAYYDLKISLSNSLSLFLLLLRSLGKTCNDPIVLDDDYSNSDLDLEDSKDKEVLLDDSELPLPPRQRKRKSYSIHEKFPPFIKVKTVEEALQNLSDFCDFQAFEKYGSVTEIADYHHFYLRVEKMVAKAFDGDFSLPQRMKDLEMLFKGEISLPTEMKELQRGEKAVYIALINSSKIKVGMARYCVLDRCREQIQAGKIRCAFTFMNLNQCKLLVDSLDPTIVNDMIHSSLPFLGHHPDQRERIETAIYLNLTEALVMCVFNNQSGRCLEWIFRPKSKQVVDAVRRNVNEVELAKAAKELQAVTDIHLIGTWCTCSTDLYMVNSEFLKGILRPDHIHLTAMMYTLLGGQCYSGNTDVVEVNPRTVELQNVAVVIKEILDGPHAPDFKREKIQTLLYKYTKASGLSGDHYHPPTETEILAPARDRILPLLKKAGNHQAFFMEKYLVELIEEKDVALYEEIFKTEDEDFKCNIAKDGSVYTLKTRHHVRPIIVLRSPFRVFSENTQTKTRMLNASAMIQVLALLAEANIIDEAHRLKTEAILCSALMRIEGLPTKETDQNKKHEYETRNFREARLIATKEGVCPGAVPHVIAIVKVVDMNWIHLLLLLNGLDTSNYRNQFLALYGISPSNPLLQPNWRCLGAPSTETLAFDKKHQLEARPCPCAHKAETYSVMIQVSSSNTPWSGEFVCPDCVPSVKRRQAAVLQDMQERGESLEEDQLALIQRELTKKENTAAGTLAYYEKDLVKSRLQDHEKEAKRRKQRRDNLDAHLESLKVQKAKNRSDIAAGLKPPPKKGLYRNNRKLFFNLKTKDKLMEAMIVFAENSGSDKFNSMRDSSLLDMVQIMQALKGEHSLSTSKRGLLHINQEVFLEIRKHLFFDPKGPQSKPPSQAWYLLPEDKIELDESKFKFAYPSKEDMEKARLAREEKFGGLRNDESGPWGGKRTWSASKRWDAFVRNVQFQLWCVKKVYSNTDEDLPELRRIFFDFWHTQQIEYGAEDLEWKAKEMRFILEMPPSTVAAAKTNNPVGVVRAKRPAALPEPKGKENSGPHSRNVSMMKQAPPSRLPSSQSQKQVPLKQATLTLAPSKSVQKLADDDVIVIGNDDDNDDDDDVIVIDDDDDVLIRQSHPAKRPRLSMATLSSDNVDMSETTTTTANSKQTTSSVPEAKGLFQANLLNFGFIQSQNQRERSHLNNA